MAVQARCSGPPVPRREHEDFTAVAGCEDVEVERRFAVGQLDRDVLDRFCFAEDEEAMAVDVRVRHQRPVTGGTFQVGRRGQIHGDVGGGAFHDEASALDLQGVHAIQRHGSVLAAHRVGLGGGGEGSRRGRVGLFACRPASENAGEDEAERDDQPRPHSNVTGSPMYTTPAAVTRAHTRLQPA